MKLGTQIDCSTGKRGAGKVIRRTHVKAMRHMDRRDLRVVTSGGPANDEYFTRLPFNRYHGWVS